MPIVTQTGSKQYIVDQGQRFVVDYIKDSKEGEVIELPVLFTFGDSKNSATVQVKVISHEKGEKLRVVKYKSKSNYHRQYGFRPMQTVLEVVSGETTKSSSTSSAKKDTKKVEAADKPKKAETKEKTKTTTKAKKTTTSSADKTTKTAKPTKKKTETKSK
jgi:large subunit ribosomal protein L21